VQYNNVLKCKINTCEKVISGNLNYYECIVLYFLIAVLDTSSVWQILPSWSATKISSCVNDGAFHGWTGSNYMASWQSNW